MNFQADFIVLIFKGPDNDCNLRLPDQTLQFIRNINRPIRVTRNITLRCSTDRMIDKSDGCPHNKLTGFKGGGSNHRMGFNKTDISNIHACVLHTDIYHFEYGQIYKSYEEEQQYFAFMFVNEMVTTGTQEFVTNINALYIQELKRKKIKVDANDLWFSSEPMCFKYRHMHPEVCNIKIGYAPFHACSKCVEKIGKLLRFMINNKNNPVYKEFLFEMNLGKFFIENGDCICSAKHTFEIMYKISKLWSSK